MDIQFIKCHGSGNDFILFDEMTNDYGFSEQNRKDIAIKLCDRETGIGGDGILFVLPSEKCDAKMRVFNADGSEPEMCGNGLRCVGRYVIDKLKKDQINVETMKTSYTVKKEKDMFDGVYTVEVLIDSITFNVADLPLIHNEETLFMGKIKELSDSVDFSAVSVTNPHLVAIFDEIDTDELVDIGQKANSTPTVLPKGVNVNFVKKIGENMLYVKTFERGVGLTKACGTGTTASSVISVMEGKCEKNKDITIINDGGMIKCRVNLLEENNYVVNFIGNATYVFSGTIDSKSYDFNKNDFDFVSFKKESVQYEEMYKWTRTVLK